MSATRGLRLLGLAGVVLLLASAYTPLPERLAASIRVPPRIEPADAIVVLANSVAPDGTLSATSLRLAVHAIRLHRQGVAPLVVFSGVTTHWELTEAQVRADLARALGVPAEAILTETRARTTYEEAVRMREILAPRGVRTVALVAETLHMSRAYPLFERAGFVVHPAPVDDPSLHGDSAGARLIVTYRTLQEIAARLYYEVAGYL